MRRRKRGGLEADHVVLRWRRGPTVGWNEASLCGPHHRHIMHVLVQPELDERCLDEDPWAVSRQGAA